MTFKQTDIKNCVLCRRGIMANNPLGLFWRLNVERLMIDPHAVQRQSGLEMMLGGAAGLANVMGPDEDMAKHVSEAKGVLVCEPCFLNKLTALFVCMEGD